MYVATLKSCELHRQHILKQDIVDVLAPKWVDSLWNDCECRKCDVTSVTAIDHSRVNSKFCHICERYIPLKICLTSPGHSSSKQMPPNERTYKTSQPSLRINLVVSARGSKLRPSPRHRPRSHWRSGLVAYIDIVHGESQCRDRKRTQTCHLRLTSFVINTDSSWLKFRFL